MKKYRPLVLLLIAVAFSVGAGYLSMDYLERREKALIAEFDEKANYTEVIVPNRDLQIGEVVSVETVSVRPVPATYIPAGTLYPDDFDSIAGLALKESVPAGRPLLRSQLDGLTGIDKFSQLLESGQRAITLPIDRIESYENMLMPGDKIDILVKNNSDGGKGEATITSLLSEVVVLATGIFTVADPQYYQAQAINEGYGSITIGVHARDVARLISANDSGELVYLLRSPSEEGRGTFGRTVGLFDERGANRIKVFSAGKDVGGLLQSTYSSERTPKSNGWRNEQDFGRLYKKFTAVRDVGVGESSESNSKEQ